MNAERLLSHYETIADAPDAIPQLRHFMLELAVRGKLVPQDPRDKPAVFAYLDEREKKGAASVEPPYLLPRTWRWVRIGDQLTLLNGMAFKPTDWRASGIPIVRIQNLNNSHARFNYCDASFARESALINNGSFLISWSGTPGTSFGAFIWDRGRAVLNQHIFRCDFKTNAFSPEYLRLAINGRLDEMIEKAHGGVGLQHITKGKLQGMLIGLPPVAEQHRIVAKFNELMRLCDRLEATRAGREAARDRFTAASLGRLNAPDPDTIRDDANFALDALPALTARADQIKTLRQAILNLAVRGKLVPQDLSDEPASELLSRIAQASRHARLAKAAVGPHVDGYPLPKNWQWVPLGQLIVSGPQNGISPKPTSRSDAPKAITLTATTSGVFEPAHFKRVQAVIPAGSDFWLRDGDLLFQRGNTRDYVGIAAIYRGPQNTFVFPDLMMRVRVCDDVSLRYVHLAAISPPARAFLSANASGAQSTMPKINQTTLVSLPIPLPPVNEQRRIVAKVDELMALCARIEASLAAADESRRRLLEALLAEAVAPEVTREVQVAV